LPSCKGHYGATWHYGFATIIDIMIDGFCTNIFFNCPKLSNNKILLILATIDE
jgi:hypothetical protein